MKHYVVGFVFDRHFKSVLLIHKLKPEWQAGKLNGVGGKVEEGEDLDTAMTREFQEETGMDVPEHMWRKYCTTIARDGTVHFFTTYANFDSRVIPQQLEVEKIVWKHYDPLAANVIDNLRWLIPMALAEVPVVADVDETQGNLRHLCGSTRERYSR